jgi:uncharacterized protein YbaR (Trm112 family)
MLNFACPSCQKKIKAPDDAAGKKVKCPACQAVFVVSQPVPVVLPTQYPPYQQASFEPRQQPQPPAKKRSVLVYILIALAIVPICCCGVVSVFLSQIKVPERTPEQVAQTDKVSQWRKNAITMRRHVQEVVTKALKSPKNAEFNLEDMRTTEVGNDIVYFVSGYVDSQNGFGAMIRTKITSVGLNDGQVASIVKIYLDDSLIYTNKELIGRFEKVTSEMPKSL